MSTYVSVSRPAARVKSRQVKTLRDFKLTQIDPFCLSRQLYLKNSQSKKMSKMPKNGVFLLSSIYLSLFRFTFTLFILFTAVARKASQLWTKTCFSCLLFYNSNLYFFTKRNNRFAILFYWNHLDLFEQFFFTNKVFIKIFVFTNRRTSIQQLLFCELNNQNWQFYK